ncbi:MAG: hypothetical protein HYY84_12320 [Deltaproteobacteria bacterium]|nr:hypothetical protein [Deltaproteobacteria bacterium]
MNAAQFVIERAASRGDKLAGHNDAADRLTAAVEASLAEAFRALGLPMDEGSAAGLGELNGMFALDAGFVEFLSPIVSEKVRPIVDQFQEAVTANWSDQKQGRSSGVAANKRSADWAQRPRSVMARVLAAVLWRTTVRSQLANEYKSPAALSFRVAEQLADIMKPGANPLATVDSRCGSPAAGGIRFERPANIPLLDVETVERLLPRGATHLGESINAYRLLYWEISTAHAQILGGNPDGRTLHVEGGWSGLARVIGAGEGGDTREEIHSLVIAQGHLCWTWPDGTYGNLVSYGMRPPRNGNPAILTITLGDALLPYCVLERFGKSGRENREARRLVPVIPLPPFVGRNRDWSAEAAFHLRLVIEFRRRAVELSEHGGVLLPRGRLERIAETAALPTRLVPRVIDRWTRDGDDGPAVLSVVERDRFTLGPAYQGAHDFLVAGAKKEVSGRAGGVASRRRKRRKAGPK